MARKKPPKRKPKMKLLWGWEAKHFSSYNLVNVTAIMVFLALGVYISFLSNYLFPIYGTLSDTVTNMGSGLLTISIFVFLEVLKVRLVKAL